MCARTLTSDIINASFCSVWEYCVSWWACESEIKFLSLSLQNCPVLGLCSLFVFCLTQNSFVFLLRSLSSEQSARLLLLSHFSLTSFVSCRATSRCRASPDRILIPEIARWAYSYSSASCVAHMLCIVLLSSGMVWLCWVSMPQEQVCAFCTIVFESRLRNCILMFSRTLSEPLFLSLFHLKSLSFVFFLFTRVSGIVGHV